MLLPYRDFVTPKCSWQILNVQYILTVVIEHQLYTCSAQVYQVMVPMASTLHETESLGTIYLMEDASYVNCYSGFL